MPAPLHVHFLDHTARMGGAQLSVLALIEDLVSGGHRCTVTLAEEGPLVGRLRAVGASVTVRDGLGIAPVGAPSTTLGRRIRETSSLLKELRRDRPDVVHVNSTKAILALGPLLRVGTRVPVLWSVRDVVGVDHFHWMLPGVIRVVARWVPAAVVGNSRFALESVASGVPRRRRHVVYPGVGPVRHREPAAARDGVRIVMPGRLAPWKGQDVLLHAVALMAHRAEAQADVVGSVLFGEHEYEADLREMIADLDLGNVKLTGFREAPEEWLGDYDILVHASRKPEAFGRVIAEGMMAGLAVVAVADGGPLEIVDDGVTGLLVAPDSPAELASALDRLIGDPDLRNALGRAGSDAALRFDQARHIAEYLAVYRSICGLPAHQAARVQSSKPLISVVVPSYHRPASLARSLVAIAGLDTPPLEVIVVCRPDDLPTVEVAARFNVRTAETTSGGLAGAMEAGGRAARGDVIAFTDDDAEPRSDWTTRIAAEYQANPRLGAFGGRDDVVGDMDEPITSKSVGRITWYGRVHGDHHRGQGLPTPVLHLKGVNMSVRRDILVEVALASEVSGNGAQFGNELFVCLAAARWGWAVRYDPNLVVVHHAAARADGTARTAVCSAQLRADVCNLALSSMLYATGIRRVTVPLYAALIGEWTRPGVLAGVALAARGRDLRYARATVETVGGVADALHKRARNRITPSASGHHRYS